MTPTDHARRIRDELHAPIDRYRIERAGDASTGYGLGWFVEHRGTAVGAWVRTFKEAIDWVDGDRSRRRRACPPADLAAHLTQADA